MNLKKMEHILCCGIERIVFFPKEKTVIFFVPKRHCSDFGGSIKLAGLLFEDVNTVYEDDGHTVLIHGKTLDHDWYNTYTNREEWEAKWN